MAFKHKKSVEDHYKGQPRPEKFRGNSAEARAVTGFKSVNDAKSKALKAKMGKKEQHFDSYYKSGKGDLGVIKKNFKAYKKYSQERASKEGT